MSAATQNARISTTAGDAFGDGAYKVATLSVKTTDASKPPRPLHIVYPIVAEEAAEFGVLLLLHGYMLNNTFYSQLMQHVASFGFVVVAPQLYDITLFNSTEAIKRAAGITAWLAGGGLQKVLPQNITADVTHRLALAGHSRGGREAFAVALGIVASSSLPLSALIGIDPVAGSRFGQTSPAVLSNDPNSSFTALNHLPVMVIGSGLDGFISCTPKGVSHAEFYRECERPACYFVVKDYGHLDMIDDDTGG